MISFPALELRHDLNEKQGLALKNGHFLLLRVYFHITSDLLGCPFPSAWPLSLSRPIQRPQLLRKPTVGQLMDNPAATGAG